MTVVLVELALVAGEILWSYGAAHVQDHVAEQQAEFLLDHLFVLVDWKLIVGF